MSAKLTGQVWELDLPHKLQSVLLALADNAHDDGTHCYPGVDYLAWKTGYDRRNVQRILRQLEEARLIIPVSGAEGGRGYGLEYNIDISKGERKRPWSEVREELRRGKQKRAAECPPLSDPMVDNLSSFPEGERAADQTVKGDNSDVKGGNSSLKGGKYAARTIENQEEPTTEHTHTARSAQPPAQQPPADSGVCVTGSKFTLQQIRAWTDHQKANGAKIDPYAVALRRFEDGKADEDIAVWLAAGTPTQKVIPRDISACPDCQGLGMCEPGGKGKGYAKCTHPRLGQAPTAQLPARASP